MESCRFKERLRNAGVSPVNSGGKRRNLGEWIAILHTGVLYFDA